MRIEKVTGWLFRLIPERVFDALSGIVCAEMDGIARDRLPEQTERKATLPAAGKSGEKEITDRMLSARHIVGPPELTSVCREALRRIRQHLSGNYGHIKRTL